MTGVTLERGDQTITTWEPVTVRSEEREQATTPYRGPYGATWAAANLNTWNAPTVALTYEAIEDPDGITVATNRAATDWIAAVETAAIITTPAGVFVPAAVLEIQTTPISNGHAVTIRLAARRELAGSDAAILRFINGDPWELR